MSKQNIINHIALVLDASSSMGPKRQELIKVADEQIAYLARRSKELDQETRVTVYVFNHKSDCVIFDKDVLRLPSIASLYHPSGNTALIDAAILSQEDLAQTFQKYGDHSFLTFVLTDGEENSSTQYRSYHLQDLLAKQADNWTVAVLVPNMNGKHEAKRFGFPADNIAIWDINSATGLAEAGETIKQATDNYMVLRSTGVKGSKTLFAGSAQQINQQTVSATGMKPLDPANFMLIPVANDGTMQVVKSGKPTRRNPDGISCLIISDFVRATGRVYEIGKAFYELVKSEKIQGHKRIAVVDRLTKKVYLGKEARTLIGLDDTDARVRPMPKDSSGEPPFKIFVESQSINRHLPLGTTLLLLK